MREPANISGVVAVHPDFVGLIFYPKSKRFVGFDPLAEVLEMIPDSVRKVGVFVDETVEKIMEVSVHWDLQAVQLHGTESPEFCKQLQERGLMILKAFSVDESFDFSHLEDYINCCNFFLFDTKSQLPGGSGQKFNWELLNNYKLNKPFFLSGGIGPDDWTLIRELSHPQLFGVDINSGFEISPAMKDIDKIGKFISKYRQ
jgi:phosphoribosylanthranilate isomerase